MTYFLDVNVLWALIDTDNARHRPVASWVGSVARTDVLLYDLVVRMALLRHFTREPRVVERENGAVISVIDAAIRHHGIRYAPEAANVWPAHERLVASMPPREAINTDVYLVAVATALGATFVTFDRAIARRFPDADILTLDVP